MTEGYAASFEDQRRLHPRLWQADYCLLSGLRDCVRAFAQDHARPGMTVIDFGCGAKPYRSLFPRDVIYTGVDVSDNPNAEVKVSPGQPVPLEDGCADVIVSTQVVYLIPEYHIYLQECRRLLKPSGFMFLSTHGTWTYHPASGGDFYRFTQDGIRHILEKNRFRIETLDAVVGTLGTGRHLRQLVFNAWLKKLHLAPVASALNIITNLMITLEDQLSPQGTRLSSPVILVSVASCL